MTDSAGPRDLDLRGIPLKGSFHSVLKPYQRFCLTMGELPDRLVMTPKQFAEYTTMTLNSGRELEDCKTFKGIPIAVLPAAVMGATT